MRSKQLDSAVRGSPSRRRSCGCRIRPTFAAWTWRCSACRRQRHVVSIRARLGPREIRAQSSLIRPHRISRRSRRSRTLAIVDAGDVDAPPVGIEPAYAAIEAGVTRILDAGATPLVVGGDHSISLPCLRAVSKTHGPLALVQFDAHIDTWGDYFGALLPWIAVPPGDRRR